MSRLKKGAAITALAVALVGGFEGLRTKAYLDVVNVPTICFGETRGVKIGDTKNVAECKAMLGEALAEFETGMRKCLKSPDSIPDRPYVAFLSLAYNVGTGAFCRSTLVKRVNAGDIRGGCDELLKWDRAGGMRWKGLTRRRQEERALCLSGL